MFSSLPLLPLQSNPLRSPIHKFLPRIKHPRGLRIINMTDATQAPMERNEPPNGALREPPVKYSFVPGEIISAGTKLSLHFCEKVNVDSDNAH